MNSLADRNLRLQDRKVYLLTRDLPTGRTARSQGLQGMACGMALLLAATCAHAQFGVQQVGASSGSQGITVTATVAGAAIIIGAGLYIFLRERSLGRAAVLDGLLTGNGSSDEGAGRGAPPGLSTIGGPPLQANRVGAASRVHGAEARLPMTSKVKRRSGDSARRSISSASGWAAIQSPTAA